jgi:hypothetical protein
MIAWSSGARRLKSYLYVHPLIPSVPDHFSITILETLSTPPGPAALAK